MQSKVIHYIEDYLAITTSWIYNQIVFNKDFEHHVFAQNIQNAEMFPVEHLHTYKDLKSLKWLYNKLFYKCFNYYPYYISLGRKIKADVIHAHFGNIGYKTIKLKERLNIPLIVTFYGYDISELARKKKYQERYKILFKKADLFLLEGNHMASELEKLGCPREKIKVFHLGTNVAGIEFRERAIKKGDPINLLFVATLTEKKGCEYLIRAYAKVVNENPNLKLKIIGQGALKTQLLDLAKKLSVYDKITFENYIPYSQFIEELYNADIFISPSVTAANGNTEGGAPVSLIDAQAAGLAIISSFHADIPEVIINGQTGLLASERDTDKIAEHILYFANNPEKIATFGRCGRKHVEEEYNITYQGEKLSKIYTETISRYKKRD